MLRATNLIAMTVEVPKNIIGSLICKAGLLVVSPLDTDSAEPPWFAAIPHLEPILSPPSSPRLPPLWWAMDSVARESCIGKVGIFAWGRSG